MDRVSVGEQPRLLRVDRLALRLAEFIEPFFATARTIVDTAARCLSDGAQDYASVAHETERDVPVLANCTIVEVDLDHRFRFEPASIAHAEIEGRANNHDHVGFLECVAAGLMKMMRVARGQSAAAGAVHVGGDVEAPAEFGCCSGRPASPHLGS
jgi:hypothetical protein